MRSVYSRFLWGLTNGAMRAYLRSVKGDKSDARLLILTLVGVRVWATTHRLDFRAAALAADREASVLLSEDSAREDGAA